MPSLKLTNPFRRGADRPSLKERAASLRETAARVMSGIDPIGDVRTGQGFSPFDGHNADAALIALGSETDAASAACQEADKECDEAVTRALPFPEPSAVLTFHEADYPFGLRRMSCHPSTLEGQAVGHDDIAWMRRGPRRHQVLREARPGEHGWRDYGGKVPEMQPWPEAQARVDEILAAWEAWQAALAAHNAKHGLIEAEARSDAAHARHTALLERMASFPAHTADGLRVKLRAAGFGINGMTDHVAGRLLKSLVRDAGSAQALPVGTDARPAVSIPAPEHDLSECTLTQLARLYEAWEGIFHHLNAVGSVPCFLDSDQNFKPAGEVLDREYDRAAAFLNVIADEAAKRVPADTRDREDRLCLLVRHEMNANGFPVTAALLPELNAAIKA